jgi:signal transduction histidine kinase
VSSPDPRDAIAEVAGIVGVGAERGGGIDAAVDAALDVLVAATGAAAVALFSGAAEDPAGMPLRSRRGEAGAAAAVASAIRAAAAPRVAAALRLGEAVGGVGAADDLSALGVPGGVIVPARLDGRTVGALAVVPPPGATLAPAGVAAARAAAQLLALGIRNALLVRGLADRARELDRQATQLRALTSVARRLSDTVGGDEAHRVIVSEARALLRADAAVLYLPGPDGVPRPTVRDGDAPVHPDPDDLTAVAAGAGPRRRGPLAIVSIPAPGGDPRPASSALVAVTRERGASFDDDDVERLGGLAAQAAVALAHADLVDDLRREQAERRVLAAAIVSAQEAERRRVAEDLHDGPVQGLVAVGLMLDALSEEISSASPQAISDVAAAASAAREAVRDLRRAISDLHPMSLEELGFASATRSLVQRLEWRGIEVSVDVAGADALSETRRTVAFRIVQEAVANILRHAEATRVQIGSRAEGDAVVIEVRDDGRGFDPGDRRPRVAEGHLGLAAIEERAALAGGHLEVASSGGRGTVLTLTLPAGEDAAQPAGVPPMRSSASARASSSANRSSTTT